MGSFRHRSLNVTGDSVAISAVVAFGIALAKVSQL
jgi:hypothetical protein